MVVQNPVPREKSVDINDTAIAILILGIFIAAVFFIYWREKQLLKRGKYPVFDTSKDRYCFNVKSARRMLILALVLGSLDFFRGLHTVRFDNVLVYLLMGVVFGVLGGFYGHFHNRKMAKKIEGSRTRDH